MIKDKGIRYGAGGLPTNFRRDENQFKQDMKRLPKQAGILRQLGVKRIATWVMPDHNELLATALKNLTYPPRSLALARTGPGCANRNDRFLGFYPGRTRAEQHEVPTGGHRTGCFLHYRDVGHVAV